MADEPVFTLMARDPLAVEVARDYARRRLHEMRRRGVAESSREGVAAREAAAAALALADRMEDWRLGRRSEA